MNGVEPLDVAQDSLEQVSREGFEQSVRSATPMKANGEMIEPSSALIRASASAPAMVPEWSSTIGW
jgi:hypothetical protein